MEEKKELTEQEKIKQIEDRVFKRQSSSLHFSRVPEKTAEWFRQYAEEEWCSDYGLAFHSLISGMMPPENTVIITRVEELTSIIEEINLRLLTLENSAKESPGEIKLMNGKRIAHK